METAPDSICTDNAAAVAVRANLIIAFKEGRMHPLPRDFKQAETAHFADLYPGTVFFIASFIRFRWPDCFGFVHVNKVNYHQSGQIAHSSAVWQFRRRLRGWF